MAIITATVVSTILGVAAPIVTEFMGLMKDKERNRHEIELLEAKSRYATTAANLELDKLDAIADIREGESLRAHDASLDGGRFINAFRASIRPFITMVFFLVFIAIKGLLIYHGLSFEGVDIITLVPLIWDIETSSIFGAVMGYWFGDRQVKRMRESRLVREQQQ